MYNLVIKLQSMKTNKPTVNNFSGKFLLSLCKVLRGHAIWKIN